jgi:hypothetical protein
VTAETAAVESNAEMNTSPTQRPTQKLRTARPACVSCGAWIGGVVFAALVCSSSACTSQDAKKDTAVDINAMRPNHGYNYVRVPIIIRGKGLNRFAPAPDGEERAADEKAADTFKLEMWEGSSARLGRGFSLRDVTVKSDTLLRAHVPAGIYPGTYRLVIRKNRSMLFTKYRYRVMEQTRNTGAPRIVSIHPETVISGHPTRLTVCGGNLNAPIRVAVEGPLPTPGSPFVKLRRWGMRFGWPIQTTKRRPLHDIRQENNARFSAALPQNLPPGRYTLQIQTTSHRGHRLDMENTVLVQTPKSEVAPALINFLIYFAVMGGVFLLGLILAWRQGDVGLKGRKRLLNLGWMVGGFLFYVLLIGSLQFVFSQLH